MWEIYQLWVSMGRRSVEKQTGLEEEIAIGELEERLWRELTGNAKAKCISWHSSTVGEQKVEEVGD